MTPAAQSAAALQAAADGVGVPAVLARGGRTPVRLARWAFIVVARRAGWSYLRIGEKLNGRDHTTIVAAHCRGLEMIERDAGFAALVARVEAAWPAAARRAAPPNPGG